MYTPQLPPKSSSFTVLATQTMCFRNNSHASWHQSSSSHLPFFKDVGGKKKRCWKFPVLFLIKKVRHGLPWWLSDRICQPMQETQVPPLIQEDPACCGAARSVHHNYWACSRPWEPQLRKPKSPQACALQQEKPPQWEVWAPQLESSPTRGS